MSHLSHYKNIDYVTEMIGPRLFNKTDLLLSLYFIDIRSNTKTIQLLKSKVTKKKHETKRDSSNFHLACNKKIATYRHFHQQINTFSW